ncbi:MAG: NAD-dependent epimerase/dehydratase family protein [candidate division Zixibacteria bacterium]|jgi:UDP-glucose 4-epimerase|nr:NAD-dependent epimerase/dehydratase family protein [candidate division Zixibacteria bacterium]
MPKLVITGGAGFIGSNLAKYYIDRRWQVVVIDDLSHGSKDNIKEIEREPKFEFILADIRSAGILEKACADADFLVHLAAYKIPRYGDALKTLTINNEGTRTVLETVSKRNIKTVIASTSDVYGKNPTPPFAESGDLVLGQSMVRRWAYAASKIFDEHLALAYSVERELPVVILRFFGSYGPGNHRSWWGGPQAVFIEQALRDLSITVHGDGRQTRSFCYVSDTVSGIASALESDKANGQIINVGSSEEIEIIELARKIISMTGSKSKIEFVPYESFGGGYEDVRRRVPDLHKADSILGFKTKVSLAEGLQRTINWHKQYL